MLYWISTARSVLFHSWSFLFTSHKYFYALSLQCAFLFLTLIFSPLFQLNNSCTWSIRFSSIGLLLFTMLICYFYLILYLFLSCSHCPCGLFPNGIEILKFFESLALSVMCLSILPLAYNFLLRFLHIMPASMPTISVIFFYYPFFICSLILIRLSCSYK